MLGVIEKAIGAQDSFLGRGASTKGPVLFPARRCSLTATSREKVKSADEISRIKNPSGIGTEEEDVRISPTSGLGHAKYFIACLSCRNMRRCRMDYANSLSSKAGRKM